MVHQQVVPNLSQWVGTLKSHVGPSPGQAQRTWTLESAEEAQRECSWCFGEQSNTVNSFKPLRGPTNDFLGSSGKLKK